MKKKEPCSDIAEWVKTINDNPDMLHLDFTPSVHHLSECGSDAVIAILPLLDSKDATERLRAQRVLEGVVKRRFGWISGQGFLPGTDGEEKTEALIIANGNYQYNGLLKARRAAIKKWKHWLSQNTDEDGK
jgi:hypothetical protein